MLIVNSSVLAQYSHGIIMRGQGGTPVALAVIKLDRTNGKSAWTHGLIQSAPTVNGACIDCSRFKLHTVMRRTRIYFIETTLSIQI